MKIAIDTLGCDHARSGFGAYILYFISNLPKNLSETGTKIELFGTEIDKYTYTSGKEIPYSSVNVKESLRAQRKFHARKIGRLIKKNGYDAVIYPAIERVLPSSFKNHMGVAIANSIVSVALENESRSVRKRILKGLRKIQIIIAASRHIKDDLVRSGIEAGKISVIHSGIDHKIFFPALHSDSEIVEIKPFAIKRPYLIYASRLSSPLKNHIPLIKAFELFKEKTGMAHRLVLAGSDGMYAEEIHKSAFESKYATDIFLTGFFPPESLAKLYGSAEACVFPSVSEGVGLPILEAMACGLPVIASDKGALKEMGGNPVLYCDTENPDEMERCIERIVEDKELRERMISDGIVRAGEFNWEKTVQETVAHISKYC